MGKTLRDHIECALDDLQESSLKKFKRKLNEVEVEAGFNQIPRGQLERADVIDIADKIVNYYREEYGLRLTLIILEEINEKKVADKLQAATGTGDRPLPPQIPGAGGSGSGAGNAGGSGSGAGDAGGSGSGASGADFVEKNRAAIISRTTVVEPILDQLLPLGLLTDEQYDRVRAQVTCQDKMRELFGIMRGWGKGGKEQFYVVLKAENGPLVRDLGGQ